MIIDTTAKIKLPKIKFRKFNQTDRGWKKKLLEQNFKFQKPTDRRPRPSTFRPTVDHGWISTDRPTAAGTDR